MPDEYQSLRYARWNDRFNTEKPYVIVSVLPGIDASQQSNIEFYEAPPEIIYDVRGRENDFNLDDNGFAFVNHSFPDFDVTNPDLVESLYQPEVEKFLKSHVDGVDRVLFFDHRVRLNVEHIQGTLVNVRDLSVALPPAKGVHIDQSEAGALRRVRLRMGEDTEYLLRGRTRILNIWRPYDYAIEDCPLALCDGSTINENDLLVADHITRTYTGETVYPLYNPAAKWYYLSQQKKDEVLILKIFDSDPTVQARTTPHTSFEHSKTTDTRRPRKSVEIRALVFTYPES
ncbi:hypothetical protein IFR04_002767 [Cadophora malorum]|uniref:Methyltransferase n=1 Tax=Cadophora malorum TaxID=108018 RepID=A0A8H8BU40_9HELO|nr:hypothetical protein IFR04_002767 [Cadophora malorum]